MKRKLLVGACLIVAAGLGLAFMPAQAQFLKKLEQEVVGGIGGNPTGMPGQAQLVGNVNLPAGNYMMQNVQTGQSFYVSVQNGQMYLSQGVTPPTVPGGSAGFGPNGWGVTPGAPGYNGGFNGGAYGTTMPGQQPNSGLGGMVRGGLGNFLKNEIMPQQQAPVQPGM